MLGVKQWITDGVWLCQVVLPNLAVLRIAVYSENGTSLLGHRILPVECLRPGMSPLVSRRCRHGARSRVYVTVSRSGL